MSVTRESLETAQDAARDARTKLVDTIAEIKARLAPATLVREAKEKVRDEANALGEKMITTARERPSLAGITAGAVFLLLFRKPIGRLIGRIFSRSGETAGRTTG